MSDDILAGWESDEDAIQRGRLIPVNQLGVSYKHCRINRVTRCLLNALELHPKDEDGGIDQEVVKIALQAIASKLILVDHKHQCHHLGFIVYAFKNELGGWTLAKQATMEQEYFDANQAG